MKTNISITDETFIKAKTQLAKERKFFSVLIEELLKEWLEKKSKEKK